MADTQDLRPEVLRGLNNATAALDAAGIRWNIPPRGAYRTRADQAALYADRARNPNPVARPGTSRHEFGEAVDLSFPGASAAQIESARQILAQNGFRRPNPTGDPVHWEYQVNRTGTPWWAPGRGAIPPVLPPFTPGDALPTAAPLPGLGAPVAPALDAPAQTSDATLRLIQAGTAGAPGGLQGLIDSVRFGTGAAGGSLPDSGLQGLIDSVRSPSAPAGFGIARAGGGPVQAGGAAPPGPTAQDVLRLAGETPPSAPPLPPDAIAHSIQAYINSLGPKPGVPPALANATPWQQKQAMDLAEAETREGAIVEPGHPIGYLPGGVVTATAGDLNLPGDTLYAPTNRTVFHSYQDLIQQLASEENRGRKAVILGTHGGAGGFSTAMQGDVSVTPQGQLAHGPPPASVDVFSLGRLLSDLPPNYKQAILSTCNPRAVLGADEPAFIQHNFSYYPTAFADKPVTVLGRDFDRTMARGQDVGVPGGLTYRTGHLPVATPVAPNWIGKTQDSVNVLQSSFADVPILAGDGTDQGTDQLSDQIVRPTMDQMSRAQGVMIWAHNQLPRWLAQDQLANYNATLGSPEMQLPGGSSLQGLIDSVRYPR